MRPLTTFAACAVLAGAGVLTGVPTADASTTHHASARHHHVKTSPYVALGDSYSSGAGINPLLDVACSRSSLNYAHDIAAVTKPASFTDVTCSGAKTQDFFSPQAGAGSPPPQLAAVSKRTRLVTMTIGGNDEDVFTGSFFGCVQVTPTDPTGNPCQQKYGSHFTDLIEQETYPNVVRALRAVRHAAPRATVVILGYPQILPPTGSPACTAVTGIAVGDVPWLVAQEKTLNRVVRRAAARTGARYVDTFTPSAGRDACSGPATRWMEPAVAPVNAYPVHPNAAGEAAMARETLAALRRR